MKKILSLLLIAALTASMISCGGSGTADTTDGADSSIGTPVTESITDDNGGDPAAAETPTVTEAVTEAPTPASPAVDGYTCVFDSGISVKLGSPAADALALLGDYSDMMEAPSCVHEGFDRVYTYADGYGR